MWDQRSDRSTSHSASLDLPGTKDTLSAATLMMPKISATASLTLLATTHRLPKGVSTPERSNDSTSKSIHIEARGQDSGARDQKKAGNSCHFLPTIIPHPLPTSLLFISNLEVLNEEQWAAWCETGTEAGTTNRTNFANYLRTVCPTGPRRMSVIWWESFSGDSCHSWSTAFFFRKQRIRPACQSLIINITGSALDFHKALRNISRDQNRHSSHCFGEST